MAAVEQLITENLNVWSSAIKTKSSAGRGSSKGLDLYGIKKLRALILELAVRGLLVPQDADDEPASKLLEKIKAKKAQLTKDKQIKKQKQLTEIKEPEKPFNVPQGWEWAKVGDVSLLKGGYAYKSKEFLEESDFQVIRMGNIRPNNFRINEKSVFITPEIAENTLEYEILSGDILLTMTGTKGKRDYLYSLLVNEQDLVKRKLYLNQRLCISRVLEANAAYLNIVMKVDSLLDSIYEKSTGTANQANIGMEAISNWVIPLPGCLEQTRIVAKVDELMALCDQLEQQQESSISAHQILVETLLAALTNAGEKGEFNQAWARIADHFDTLFTTGPCGEWSIDQLKQTILQLAVMGKLVPQDPNLMKHLAKNYNNEVIGERALASLPKSTGKYEKSIFDSSKNRVVIPDNWSMEPLADLALTIVDCPHSTPKWSDSGEICVRTSQFKPGLLDLSSTRYVSSETYLKRVERLVPEEGDILYSREGGILGVACIIPNGVKLCLGQRMMLIRPPSFIESKYLEMILNSPFINAVAQENTTGGAAPRVNLTTVKAYPVPIPPIEEQNRIVAKVDGLMSLCENLKTRINESQTTQLHLADAMAEQALS